MQFLPEVSFTLVAYFGQFWKKKVLKSKTELLDLLSARRLLYTKEPRKWSGFVP